MYPPFLTTSPPQYFLPDPWQEEQVEGGNVEEEEEGFFWESAAFCIFYFNFVISVLILRVSAFILSDIIWKTPGIVPAFSYAFH